MTKIKDCYKKTNPEGVLYPANMTDVSQIRAFFCQKTIREIMEKTEECAGVREETTKEKEEKEKKLNECFENYMHTHMGM